MIRAGTLCIVYTCDHKCLEQIIGRIVEYDPVPSPHPSLYCRLCGTPDIVVAGTEPLSWFVSGKGAIPARWLKPLPPLSAEQERELAKVAA